MERIATLVEKMDFITLIQRFNLGLLLSCVQHSSKYEFQCLFLQKEQIFGISAANASLSLDIPQTVELLLVRH